MAKIYCVKKNLFDMPHGYCFAHCISNDFALAAGIALEFNRRYNMSERLKSVASEVNLVGEAVKIDNVYNLITKDKCYLKPTYESLRDALEDMAEQIVDDGVKYLAMPKIGAGLDKLNWNIVFSIIKDVFEDVDVDIIICFLDDDPDFPSDKGKHFKEEDERDELMKSIEKSLKERDTRTLYQRYALGINLNKDI
jgi:hypothetical protein